MTTTTLPIFTAHVEGVEHPFVIRTVDAATAWQAVDLTFPGARSVGLEHTTELAEAAEARQQRHLALTH